MIANCSNLDRIEGNLMNSKEVNPLLDQAKQLIRSGQASGAIKLLEKQLQDHPGDRSAQELLGMCYFSAKQLEQARDAFNQLTRMDPKYSAGWVNLGAVQNLLKDFNGATKNLRKAIQIDKKCASAYYNLGIAQKAMKSNSMAVSAYKEAIRLAPDMAEPYANLANLYIEMKNYRQAVKTADEGVERCPKFKKIKLIRDKAMDLKEGNRREESPLGRLVNEEELARKQVRVGSRGLDATIRNEERDTLRTHAKAIRKDTKPIVPLLDERLHQQIHVLSLAASQKDNRGEGQAALESMRETVEEIDRLRASSRNAIMEIRQQLQKTDPGL